MTREEFKEHLKNKMKGIIPDSRVNAQMLEEALVIGEEILQLREKLADNDALLKNLKTHFPLVYNEAKLIFNRKPTSNV